MKDEENRPSSCQCFNRKDAKERRGRGRFARESHGFVGWVDPRPQDSYVISIEQIHD